MKIAQLTLDGYENYGQVLQRYALQRILKNFADVVEVLHHQRRKNFIPYTFELERSEVKNARDVAFKSVRQSKIKEFSDVNICTRFDLPYLEEFADEYDFFIVGSDQVWNPEKYFQYRFLEFAPPEKRIAYAASFGVEELPTDIKAYYREKISEMAHVSVREKNACDFVEEFTGKRPLQILDPVFLLTADEWRKFEKRPIWLNEKTYGRGYLLTYFFKGTPSKQSKELAGELNLPMINLLDLNKFDYYATGIEEFLYLMAHATLICTQSFHGIAFAIIFKRPFAVNKIISSGFSRIKSLLELFNFSDRLADDLQLNDFLNMDFSHCDEIILAERNKSLKFLSEALSTGGN